MKRRLTFGGELLVHLLDHALYVALIEMPSQLGLNAAGMDGCRADAARPMSLIKSHREQNVGRLRAPVSQERVVGRVLEIRVLEIHVGEAVSC